MRILTIVAAFSLTFGLAACDEPADDADRPGDDEVQQQQDTEERIDDDDSDQGIDGEPEADSEDGPDIADDLEPGETGHYGAEFTIDDDAMSLSDALALLDDAEDGETSETVKIEADVNRVCQSKGCWFTLEQSEVDVPVRVRMVDYGFLVPRNTEDAQTVVEGTLKAKTIDEELAQHYAEDVAEETGEEPEQVEGPQDTYRFTATGLSMTRPES